MSTRRDYLLIVQVPNTQHDGARIMLKFTAER